VSIRAVDIINPLTRVIKALYNYRTLDGGRMMGVEWFKAGLGALVARVGGRSQRKGEDPSVPPGSLGLPILGETISYAKNPHEFFETRVAQYGPVFKTRLLGHNTACFTGPEAFTFFVNQPSFRREGANPGHVQELFCHDSLPLIDGAEHEGMRSAVMKAFDLEATETYLSIIETATLAHLKKWEEMGSFAWATEYKKLSASICAAILLGASPNGDNDHFVDVLDPFIAGVNALPINLPWTTYGKATKKRDLLLSYIDEAIAEHRENPHKDMLAELMMAKSNDGSQPSEQQLRAQMVHIFFAAYGNIYRVLTLMCMSLSQNPGVMDKARQEVVDHASEGRLTLQQLGRLRYLDQVTREVRRHNRIFASTFFDRVTMPVDYREYHIPNGWKATGGIYTTMQDTGVFTNPAVFDPDRFGPERAEDQRKANSYIPQGGGPMEGHRCPAEDFSTVLMKAVAALLLRSYKWELVPQDMTLSKEASPLPRDGLKVNFERP
jgi:cytochrome P450